MVDLTHLPLKSNAVFPKSETPRCIFCGEGPQWFDTRSAKGETLIHGCRCRWANAVREGKLAFQMLYRPHVGYVITKCAPELVEQLLTVNIAAPSVLTSLSRLGYAVNRSLPDETVASAGARARVDDGARPARAIRGRDKSAGVDAAGEYGDEPRRERGDSSARVAGAGGVSDRKAYMRDYMRQRRKKPE